MVIDIQGESGHDITAEQSVIGVALGWPEKIPTILSRVSSADFCEDLAPWIMALEELSAAWKEITIVTWLHQMDNGDPEEAHRRRQLALQFGDLAPTATTLECHLKIIQDMSKYRRLQRMALQIASAPPTLDGLAEIVEDMVGVLHSEKKQDSRDMVEMWQLFEQLHDTDEPPKFARTGLSRLDERVFMREGRYGFIAAYPSVGKTALSIKFALNFAAQGYRVGYFSMETDHAGLIERIATAASGIDNLIIQKNRLTRGDWAGLSSIVQKTSAYPIDWIEASGMTVTSIRERTRVRKYDVIFIDYIQLIPSSQKRYQSRYEIMTETSIALHNLAQQQKVLVIPLSQLSRPDKFAGPHPPPPTMSSLRESGQLEQDADFILALYEDDLTQAEINSGCTVPDGDTLLMCRVLKNKTGPKNGGIHILFSGRTQRFRQLEAPNQRNGQRAEYTQMAFEELPDDMETPFN